MKAVRIGLCAFGLVILLAQCAFSAQVWTEQRITNTPWDETGPKVYGNALYYNDFRSGSADVYVWDQTTGSRPVIQLPGTQVVDAVYGNNVVYRSYSQEAEGYADLYLWDPIQGTTPICTAVGDQINASMYGNMVTWQDYRTGTPQVHVWDPVNGDRAIAPTGTAQRNPKIWGNTVVWEDYRSGYSAVYRWNPTDGMTYLGADMVSPAIYGDKVVMWRVSSVQQRANEPGLWQWTPQNGGVRLNNIEMYSAPAYSGVWGDIVVWSGNGPGGVASWDPVYGMNRINQSALGNAYMPSIYGKTVAWVGNDDVCISTFVPEPSSLCILLLGCIGLMCRVIRRRAEL